MWANFPADDSYPGPLLPSLFAMPHIAFNVSSIILSFASGLVFILPTEKH